MFDGSDVLVAWAPGLGESRPRWCVHAVPVLRRLSLPAVAAFALLALAGCSSSAGATLTPSPAATAFVVNGSITVPGMSETGSDDEVCAAREGFDDIAVGGQVTVSDASGKTIAIGTVGRGGFVKASVSCRFLFSVLDVPLGEKFYGVHVGKGPRGIVQFTRAEMQAGPELSLTR